VSTIPPTMEKTLTQREREAQVEKAFFSPSDENELFKRLKIEIKRIKIKREENDLVILGRENKI
jgi:hypothetical protein